MAWASQRFQLQMSSDQDVDAQIRQAMKSAKDIGGCEDLSPEPPFPLSHIWWIFNDLHGARSSNGFGPSPVAFSEIAAYAHLHGYRLNSFEVGVLRQLDIAYMRAFNERSSRTESADQ